MVVVVVCDATTPLRTNGRDTWREEEGEDRETRSHLDQKRNSTARDTKKKKKKKRRRSE